jgi:hypothetical protein
MNNVHFNAICMLIVGLLTLMSWALRQEPPLSITDLIFTNQK